MRESLIKRKYPGVDIRLIYSLEEELENDPGQVKLAQALTLNPLKPLLGLKGVNGLFGSQNWWDNIYSHKIQLEEVSGVVRRAYVSGQDYQAQVNTLDIEQIDGSVATVGVYANKTEDVRFLRVGCQICIIYALDELKKQPALDGSKNFSRIALEMAILASRPASDK